MNTINTDILVIGSGIAGLHYAIRCSQFARVLIVTKGKIGESNTMYAQGGIAAVFDTHDSVEDHVRDTLVAGDGLCREDAVRLIAENAKQCILNLCNYHVNFDKTRNGEFDLHREGGHSCARVVHTADATGREVETAMVSVVRNNNNITVLEHHLAIDLFAQNNICTGALIVNKNTLQPLIVNAKTVMLATGGAGQLYLQNTNPSIATGDGYAIAQRAGAIIGDIEFVQFHPTTLYNPGHECFLISEAVRGFGAPLKNKAGEAFMDNCHQLKSLAPRDIVTRAIVKEMTETGEPCVYLDLRGLDIQQIEKHFPNIAAQCNKSGFNPEKEMIPVVPAAHYMCGGVVTDLKGRTSIKNLYACGEVSCTGVHGANRLASNSLLEGLVFAEQAEKDTKININHIPLFNNKDYESLYFTVEPDSEIKTMKAYLQHLMWQHAGIIRNQVGLEYCTHELSKMRQKLADKIAVSGLTEEKNELKNMIDCSLMILHSASLRQESRGCHYRDDYHDKSLDIEDSILTPQNFSFSEFEHFH